MVNYACDVLLSGIAASRCGSCSRAALRKRESNSPKRGLDAAIRTAPLPKLRSDDKTQKKIMGEARRCGRESDCKNDFPSGENLK
jgi:hypothetical protein